MRSIFERVKLLNNQTQSTETEQKETQATFQRYQKPLIAASIAGVLAWLWFNVDSLTATNHSSNTTTQTQLQLPQVSAEHSLINAEPTIDLPSQPQLTSAPKTDTILEKTLNTTTQQSNINQQVVELLQVGKTIEATRLLEDAISQNPEAGILFENLRSLYAGFASQSYQAALNPGKVEQGQTKITLLVDSDNVQEITLPSLKAQAQANTEKIAIKPTPSPVIATTQPTIAAVDNKQSNTATSTTVEIVNTAPKAESTIVATAVTTETPQPTTTAANDASPTTSVEKTQTKTEEIAQATPTTPVVETKPSKKEQEKAVLQAAYRWALAWSKQDVEAYFASYSPNFLPQKTNYATWQEQRKTRIQAPSFIKVELSNIQIQQISERKARLRLTQAYQSSTFNSTDQKTLELAYINNKWLIVSESGR